MDEAFSYSYSGLDAPRGSEFSVSSSVLTMVAQALPFGQKIGFVTWTGHGDILDSPKET
jgi:hypothetical protein